VDRFLYGLKAADLPEGKAMMIQAQWVTGAADYGQNFYARPVYTDAKTIFESMFDTDVPGVRGYKRLVELDGVSEAKTTLKIRLLAIAYQDRRSGEWKVLYTGTDKFVDVGQRLAWIENHLKDTRYLSEQENYYEYGISLCLAGRIAAAKDALLEAEDAKTVPTGNTPHPSKYYPRPQIDALLAVIAQIS